MLMERMGKRRRTFHLKEKNCLTKYIYCILVYILYTSYSFFFYLLCHIFHLSMSRSCIDFDVLLLFSWLLVFYFFYFILFLLSRMISYFYILLSNRSCVMVPVDYDNQHSFGQAILKL